MTLVNNSITPDEGEHLATGWEPDLPVDDTLVRQAVHRRDRALDGLASAREGHVSLTVLL